MQSRELVSTGVPQLMVPIRSLVEVQRLDPGGLNVTALNRTYHAMGTQRVMVFTTETEGPADERYKYLRLLKARCLVASREEKTRLLNEMETVTGLHRKHLIRLLGGDLRRQPRRQERGAVYGPDIDDALRVISESWDHICPERLTPNLVWMAEHLERHGEMRTTPGPVGPSARNCAHCWRAHPCFSTVAAGPGVLL